MLRLIFLCIATIIYIIPAHSSGLSGKVIDSKTGEELVGASIYIKELKRGVVSGLDGSYVFKNISSGKYTIVCSFISYQSIEQRVNLEGKDIIELNFKLLPMVTELEQVSIVGYSDKSTEISARSIERNSIQVVNVVSSKTIELSPDLNVANVLQRMSGVTIDKSSSSSGQYALLRGMDKRYNYTLVNGIKIPGTHSKHRYVSLGMFPSDMIERIEVTKALMPDMEGDAVAGVVNLVMKNAPGKLLVQANASAGYSHFFSSNDFQSFSTSSLNSKSPYERNGSGYQATINDFPTHNLAIKTVDEPINYFGNVTVGNRFFNKQLGWIVSGSIQNNYNGESSLYFKDNLSRDGQNLPILTSMIQRIYSEKKQTVGLHNKFDLLLGGNSKILLYLAYLDISSKQIRDGLSTDLAVSYDPDNGYVTRSRSVRNRFNEQSLFNSTLQGEHQLTKKISAKWSAVYSKADNRTPDESTVSYGNSLENHKLSKQYVDFDGSDRIWRRNSDNDIAAYLNVAMKTTFLGAKTEFVTGGLYRQKERTSFYNKYTLKAIVEKGGNTSFYSEKGVDWNTFDQIKWQVYNPRGTVAVGENYDASETVLAGYGLFRIVSSKLEVSGGIRIENTEQGYSMKFPIGELNPTGNQKYTDFLPSIHVKYSSVKGQSWRLSYYKATNKAGFQEIVPFIDASEELVTAGNKNLKHATADNIDLRWEFFPSPLDQIMIGTFFKKITNPIEFAFDKFMNVSQQIVYTPINSDKAQNYGVEIDLTKYFRNWGIKGNYTLTRSDITTNKLSRVKDSSGNDATEYIPQKRPLFGQSENVGNLSLLYKSSNNGLNGQLAFSYTGDRIYTVSRYIDNDLWQKGFWQLDASVDINIGANFSLFAKAQNLLNSHVKVYIRKTNPMNNDVPFHYPEDKNTLVRDEFTMASWLVGFRYKL